MPYRYTGGVLSSSKTQGENLRPYALLLITALALPVSAQEARVDDTESAGKKPKVDETIVVTATRSERTVSELPISTTVVPESKIKATPAHTIDDVLRTIPGVNMPIASAANTGVQNHRVSMRGLGGQRTLVLLDGVPIHDPYYGTIEWQKVPIDSIKQVEVVRGANASLFGNFAAGGTINLVTRPVDNDEVRVETSYGTDASQKQTLTIDQMLSSRWSARLSHDRWSTNGTIRVPQPGAIDVPGWLDSAITSARTEYRPSDRSNAYFKASTAEVDVSQGTHLSYVKREIADFSSGLQSAVGGNGLVSATLFRQHENMRIATASTIGGRNAEFVSSDSNVPSNESGASADYSLQRSGALAFVSFGFDVTDIDATEHTTNLDRNARVTQRDVLTGHQRFAGIFAQASWRPVTRFEALLSARYDYFTNTGASDVVLGGTTTVYPSTTSRQIDPRLSLRYALNAGSAVRGAAYRGFRAPTLRELYRNSQSGASTVMANPFLKPETLTGAELGYEWAGSRAHLEVNVFRNDIKGIQVRVPVAGGGGNVVQNINAGSARAQGVELMTDVRLSPRWSVDAGYTYCDSTTVDTPVDRSIEGKILPDVAPHYGSLSVRYVSTHGTSVDVRGRVVSRSYGEPANVVPAPAHRILDLAVSHPVRGWIDAYAMLENAFDDHYFYVLTPTSFRNGQPRAFSAGLRMRVPTSFGSTH
jgi:outer membrane receptor protein involved in Fe transport